MVFDKIRTAFSFFLIATFLILYTPFFIAISIFPKKKLFKSKAFFFFGDILYRVVVWCTFLRIKVIGKENIPKSSAIIAGNHQSSLDIPIMGSLIHRHPHAWMATSDLQKTYLQRLFVKAAIIVDVETPMKAMRSLLEAIKTISENKKLHLMIFPEGGRFTDGKIHDFFAGFAMLARKTGLPVVPVCMFGLNKAYPPKKFLIRRIPITVIVGKPFVIGEDETDEEFKNRVHAWFVQQNQD
ncbi:MAG: 1-acyl-sn-glycerol-3-phosphate acyltransferase [Candidatus Babeliales bacterium]|nr:1-acyl-sn-glycerol-3-phosphate acyltransferase [Candidatus Babeliales bacterium]